MQEFVNTYPNIKAIPGLDDPGCLYLDLETTGLSAKRDRIYLLGVARVENGLFTMRQVITDDPADEPVMLRDFLRSLKGVTRIVSFNGDRFDLPFLIKRAEFHGLEPAAFRSIPSTDLLRAIKPFLKGMILPDHKQQTLEKVLGTGRTEDMSGKELISVYYAHERDPRDAETLRALLAHNEADILGLGALGGLTAYPALLAKAPRLIRAHADSYRGAICPRNELVMEFSPEKPLPIPLFVQRDGVLLRGGEEKLLLRVPLISDRLKLYFENYADYDYFPEEDCAYVRAVGIYAEKGHRERATRATAYQWHKGLFLPQWRVYAEPVYRMDLEGPISYFELTTERKADRLFLEEYAGYLISSLILDQ